MTAAAVGVIIDDKSKQGQDHLCNLRLLHAKSSLAHAAPAEGEATISHDNPTVAAAGESPGEAIAYADDEPFYDVPEDTNKSKEGNDWIKENYCEGYDCEFSQALDSHCCFEDAYAEDEDNNSSDSKPNVPTVIPALPIAVDYGNAATDSVMAFVSFSDPVHKVAKCVKPSTVLALLRISGFWWSITPSV